MKQSRIVLFRDRISSLERENEALRKDLERSEKKLSHYMNRNCEIWLAASKVAGGLEALRGIPCR